MKLDIDCMRDILLYMETFNYQEEKHISIVHKELKYTPDTIDYTILKLKEADFITTLFLDLYDGIQIINLCDITYEGHQFLEAIRPESIWKPTKKIGAKIGASTISGITQIATGVLT